MKNKAFLVFIYCGLFMQSLCLQAENKLVLPSAFTGVVAGVSLVQGLYNVRLYNQIISQCQLDYGLSKYVNWKQYPSQAAQNFVCMNGQPLDTTFALNHEYCMLEVAKKINLFDSINPEIVWNFQLFKDAFPHTDFQSAYCVSKSYLGSFGYKTLENLKFAVSYQILKIESDFKTLISLTDLSWSDIKMAKTLHALDQFKVQLSQCHNFYGAYTWLGACGYSSLHNGQRIKAYLLSLTKIHAFLINFQELLNTCVDRDDTQLINAQGLLNFSIQHINYTEKRL